MFVVFFFSLNYFKNYFKNLLATVIVSCFSYSLTCLSAVDRTQFCMTVIVDGFLDLLLVNCIKHTCSYIMIWHYYMTLSISTSISIISLYLDQELIRRLKSIPLKLESDWD